MRRNKYNLRGVFLTKPIMDDIFVNTSAVLHNYLDVTYYQQTHPHPLLILFTTFTPVRTKWLIYYNTIRVWGLLQPFVQPVIFCEEMDADIKWMFQHHGWKILPVPVYRYGVPVLSKMFTKVISLFDASFYGYANGDILFDESLTLTLISLQQEYYVAKDTFIIGRRLNHDTTVQDSIASLDQLRTMARNASIFMSQAMDYFITTRKGFLWSGIPDFVVGKRGNDNWIVMHALRHSAMTIDTTNSVLSLHQSDAQGQFEGRNSNHSEINMELIGNISMTAGHTDCMKWETRLHQGQPPVMLIKRTPNPCFKELSKYNISLR